MMVTPSGRRSSAPSPQPIASGTAPRMAAKVVIMIGRKRVSAAWRIASRGDKALLALGHRGRSRSS